MVMHGDFEPGTLPHERASPYEFARSDRRTFGQLFDTAKNVYNDCSSGKFQGQVPLGWSEEGMMQSKKDSCNQESVINLMQAT